MPPPLQLTREALARVPQSTPEHAVPAYVAAQAMGTSAKPSRRRQGGTDEHKLADQGTATAREVAEQRQHDAQPPSSPLLATRNLQAVKASDTRTNQADPTYWADKEEIARRK